MTRYTEPKTIHECERCGKPLAVIESGKVGALYFEIVRCESGHKYIRYRLADIG